MGEFTLSGYALTILAFGAIAFGLYLLIKGGDWTVDAATYIAERSGLSHMFIGATVVAFGTSVPELFTSVNANLSGYPGLSVGNIVGSNIANLLLILGVTAIVFTVQTPWRRIQRDVLVVALATALLCLLMLNGLIERWHGAVMVALIIGYVVWQLRTDDGEADDEEDWESAEFKKPILALATLLGGLVMLAVGSELLVQGAVAAGTALGVPEAIIGLTIVAFGTSLPELATCLAAAMKRRTGMIIGNILGSNLFNILWIIGVTAALKPLVVTSDLAGFSMWFMAASTIAFAVWMIAVGRISRPIGIAMVAAYIAFVAYVNLDVIFPGSV